MTLLELQNVRKYFPGPKHFLEETQYVRAVDHVDLTIVEGENLGLVGESGSGKTTLGRLIMKLHKADSGAIILNGKDISKLSDNEFRPLRKNVQMVFQDPYSSLDPRFTVHGLLAEADQLSQEKKDRNARLEKAIQAVGLDISCLKRYPHEFSGGERQRIAIARCLVMNPKLLILDEAVSSLDVLIQEQVLQLLKSLQQQYPVTYLFISHNLRVVRKICHKIAVMYRGKIVELAASDEILRNPLHPYTKELLTAAIDYKSVDKPYNEPIGENSRLIDNGNGHFVIN